METLILFSREILGTSECDLQVVGWCDVCWKVLRQHLNASFMKIRKKKRDRETVLACEKRNKTSIK